MAITKTEFKSVDEYFSTLTPKAKKLLKELRKAIKEAAPEAEEIITYNMPAYKYHGILVYYAAHTEHIGFYPGNKVVNEVFKKDLVKYKTSKGTIQFPMNEAIPVGLIGKIVKYRIKENLKKAKEKAKKKK